MPVSALAAACDHGCSNAADCEGHCGQLPPRFVSMPQASFAELLEFANDVQAWSFERNGDTTFGEAASHFAESVDRIADAVTAHYWMYTPDRDRPLSERRIEHEGE